MSKYLRGYALFLWEILINNMAKINHAIVYSFTGNFEMAKRQLKGKNSEVILVIDCPIELVEEIKNLLWEHLALGVAKVEE